MKPTRNSRVVLVGGGHAHLQVLEALSRDRLAGVDVTLVSPRCLQIYSGMLPGWMAGHYPLSHCHIDLGPLAQAAGVKLILETMAGMDANKQCIALSNGEILEYDLLSLNTGGESDVSWLKTAGEKLLPVRPLEDFIAGWASFLADISPQTPLRLVVIGAGAAGVELAFAVQYACNQRRLSAKVDLVSSEHFLNGHHESVVRRALGLLAKRGISLHIGRAVGAEEGVLLENGELITADRIIATTGARAPYWLQISRLALDAVGYISVDAMHRSLSHPNVFAVGDVCSRTDTHCERSGVHAVKGGAVVAYNLLATLRGSTLKRYHPKRRTLYLLATGPRHAIASWGAWSAQGGWVWYWKDWLDKHFILRHTRRLPIVAR